MVVLLPVSGRMARGLERCAPLLPPGGLDLAGVRIAPAGSWALRAAPQVGLWLASPPEGSLVRRDRGLGCFKWFLFSCRSPRGFSCLLWESVELLEVNLRVLGAALRPGSLEFLTPSCVPEPRQLPVGAGVSAQARVPARSPRAALPCVATAPSAPTPRAAPARCPPRLCVPRELRIGGQPRFNLPLHLTGAFRAPSVQHRPEGAGGTRAARPAPPSRGSPPRAALGQTSGPRCREGPEAAAEGWGWPGCGRGCLNGTAR